MKHISCIIAILISISSYSQTYQIYQNDTINRIDQNGLKYGRWIYFEYCADTSSIINDNNIFLFCEGYYSILSLSDSLQFNDCKLYSSGDLFFKKDRPTFYCSGRYRNQYSVRDGYWLYFFTRPKKNEIHRIFIYEKGFQLQEKYFEDGSLSSENFDRLYNGGKVQDTYLDANSFMYKRDYWAKTDSDLNKELYYPDSPLNIVDCELSFSTTLSQTDTATIKIISNSKKEIVVDSILCSDYQIIPLTNKNVIDPKDTFDLRILYNPDRYHLRSKDTLCIYTSAFPFCYNVYFDFHAYDLAYRNAKKIKEIKLIKEADKQLIFYVCDLGWHSWIEIRNNTGELVEKFFLREAGCKNLDLSGYKTGTYKIHVETGDEKKYDYKLSIK